jgi:TolA-binding protein
MNDVRYSKIGGARWKFCAFVLVFSFALSTPSFAVNKDMVQLQQQVQDLQDAVAKLQQSNDERMGVLQHLVEQSVDSVNKMSLTIDTLGKQMRSQQDATGGKMDQVSGQVQALNDSVDEIKARLNRLEKALQDLQTQEQSINANLQNLTPPAGTTAPADGSSAGPTAPPMMQQQAPPPQVPIVNRRGKPSAGVPMAAVTDPVPDVASTVAPSAAAPASADLYKTALSDYMAAKYPLASSEFAEVGRMYPDDALAGNSYYYLGEIDYRNGKYAAAVKNYDRVLDQFPDNSKVAVAHLHKGMALFQLKQNDAGVRELRALITRFPNSPEAAQARSKLNGMGVPIVPRTR